MKIGTFAKKFGVSVDTVRFYINKGLIIPDTQSSQMNFTERDCSDMQNIVRMKQQQFTLKEIREYLSVLRISNMVEPESIQDVIGILEHKKTDLDNQADTLRRISESIENDISELNLSTGSKPKKTGVPIKALPILACPYCHKPLQLKKADLDSRYIYNGTIVCACGYKIKIDNGIIKTGNIYTAPYDKPDLARGLYRNVSEDFITYLQRSSDLALKELQGTVQDKVIMEGHCNGYFFSYNHLKELENGNLYIITDKYPEMLEMYKRNIENLALDLDIVYLADASINHPLKLNSIDMLIDFMGDNEHSLYFKNFYLADVKRYLSHNAVIIGAVLGYDYGAKSIEALLKKYPEGDAHGYCRYLWDKLYKENGYVRQSQLIGTLQKSYNKYSFECHCEGENLYMEYFTARPKTEK